jgi:hypothetical protein
MYYYQVNYTINGSTMVYPSTTKSVKWDSVWYNLREGYLIGKIKKTIDSKVSGVKRLKAEEAKALISEIDSQSGDEHLGE